MDKQTEKVRKKYDRISYFYDFSERLTKKKLFSKWRKNLVGRLQGKVLEIGVGTGKNLPYYNKKAEVTGIDISQKMFEKARKRALAVKRNFNLLIMDAQKLKFKDESFDYVVCTFVLCSVPTPVRVLKEMKRVSKTKGKLLMIEHILSDNFFIALLQHIHNPLTKILFGVNINRDTIENINKAGLKIKKHKNLALFDVFKKIEAVK